VGIVQKKRDDFFEYFFADVDGAVDAVGRLGPIHFAYGDGPRQSVAAVAKLDVKPVAAQDHGEPMKRIVMPGCCLSRRQPLPSHQVISAMMQDLLHRTVVSRWSLAKGKRKKQRWSSNCPLKVS
jgi:hypothetical protein